MSYIRSLSNPESLYIWAGAGGGTCISYGHEEPVTVNSVTFDRLLRKCAYYHLPDMDEPIRVGNLTVEEVWVPNGKRPTKLQKATAKALGHSQVPVDLKVRLTVHTSKGKRVFDMWRVTWN